MKTPKLILTSALLFCFVIATGQITSTNRNIPAWGIPVTSERYYYIPDIQTYYDIPSREYVYLNNGNWVRSRSVPAAYKNYDFLRGKKVAINDYHGNAPYTYYNVHRVKYVSSPHKVYVNPNKAHKHGNGKARGHAYGHTKGRGHAKH